MHTILLVGTDPSLLSSRSAVLRRTGARTVFASAFEALAVQTEQEAELVVLCHTLPDLTCLAISRSIHERWPSTRVLQMLPLGQDNASGYVTGADAISYSQPECLLKKASELLGILPAPPVEISRWKAAMSLH